MSDVIVIGAGIGGLCAAIRLASQGIKVHVLEAAPKSGGKASTELLDGVDVDTGPSVLTLPEVFDRLFVEAGTSLQAHVRLRTPEPAFRYLFPDGTRIDLFHDPGASLDSVERALGTDARRQLDHFLEYAKRVWAAGAPHFVFAPAPSMATLLRMGTSGISALRHIDPIRTMERAINNRIKDPYLRWILLRYATYNGSDPRSAPATLNCIAWVELGLGGYGVDGGIYALVEALESVARDQGVRFSHRSPVQRIVVRHGSVVGVETESGMIEACSVVANADVASVVTDLLPSDLLPIGARTRLSAAPLSTSAYNAVVSRDTESGPLVAHTVAFPERYHEEFADLFDHGRSPRDPTVYACAPAAAHGRPRWKGREPVFLMANAPAEPNGPPIEDPHHTAFERRVLDRARGAGLIAPTDPVLWCRTPSDLARQFSGSGGALYGAASNDRFAAFRRPPNRVARIKGLYLASGSAHPGGGMPLCALSGRHAAQEVIRDLDRKRRKKGTR